MRNFVNEEKFNIEMNKLEDHSKEKKIRKVEKIKVSLN